MNKISNIHQLRTALCETVEGLREGTVPPATAEAISNASGKVVQTIRLQLEFARQRNEVPVIPFMDPANVEVMQP